jgi:hypothetical protein
MEEQRIAVLISSVLEDEEAIHKEQAEQILSLRGNGRQSTLSAVAAALDRDQEAHVRVPFYYSDVCCRKSDADFKSDYRVDRATFKMLCQLVSSAPEFMPSQTGSIDICIDA